MKALVQDTYGSPEGSGSRRSIRRPPGPTTCSSALRAASVHPDIWHVLDGLPYVLRLTGAGLSRPAHPVPGLDMAGTVEAVIDFRPGDEVFGETVQGYTPQGGPPSRNTVITEIDPRVAGLLKVVEPAHASDVGQSIDISQ